MITSTANAQVRQIEKLHKSARERKKTGLYLAEGLRTFSEAPRDRLEKAYATERFYEEHRELFTECAYEMVSEAVFKQISGTMTPQGVLMVLRQADWKLSDILEAEKPFIIALENLQDPGNLGTIIRTAEGAGATGVIMSRDTVDIYNSKVVRSTMGSVFRVPFVYVDDIVETAEQMKEKGIHTYGGHLDGENAYTENFREPSAFFIGNEGNGLTQKLAAALMHRITIPMMGRVESLNAATAAAVLMYETLRQRSGENR